MLALEFFEMILGGKRNKINSIVVRVLFILPPRSPCGFGSYSQNQHLDSME